MDRFQNWTHFPCIHHMSSSFKVRSSTYLKLKLKSATPQSPHPRLATDLFMLRAWKCWGTLQLIAGHQHSPSNPSCQHRSAVLQCTYLACMQHHPCSVTLLTLSSRTGPCPQDKSAVVSISSFSSPMISAMMKACLIFWKQLPLLLLHDPLKNY